MGKHNTLIDGTAHSVKGGKLTVGGTGHNIKKGRTEVEGAGYDIKFEKDFKPKDLFNGLYFVPKEGLTEFKFDGDTAIDETKVRTLRADFYCFFGRGSYDDYFVSDTVGTLVNKPTNLFSDFSLWGFLMNLSSNKAYIAINPLDPTRIERIPYRVSDSCDWIIIEKTVGRTRSFKVKFGGGDNYGISFSSTSSPYVCNHFMDSSIIDKNFVSKYYLSSGLQVLPAFCFYLKLSTLDISIDDVFTTYLFDFLSQNFDFFESEEEFLDVIQNRYFS